MTLNMKLKKILRNHYQSTAEGLRQIVGCSDTEIHEALKEMIESGSVKKGVSNDGLTTWIVYKLKRKKYFQSIIDFNN